MRVLRPPKDPSLHGKRKRRRANLPIGGFGRCAWERQSPDWRFRPVCLGTPISRLAVLAVSLGTPISRLAVLAGVPGNANLQIGGFGREVFFGLASSCASLLHRVAPKNVDQRTTPPIGRLAFPGCESQSDRNRGPYVPAKALGWYYHIVNYRDGAAGFARLASFAKATPRVREGEANMEDRAQERVRETREMNDGTPQRDAKAEAVSIRKRQDGPRLWATFRSELEAECSMSNRTAGKDDLAVESTSDTEVVVRAQQHDEPHRTRVLFDPEAGELTWDTVDGRGAHYEIGQRTDGHLY